MLEYFLDAIQCRQVINALVILSHLLGPRAALQFFGARACTSLHSLPFSASHQIFLPTTTTTIAITDFIIYLFILCTSALSRCTAPPPLHLAFLAAGGFERPFLGYHFLPWLLLTLGLIIQISSL